MASHKILAVQHVLPETPGLIEDAVSSAGHELSTIRVFRNEHVPASMDDYDALVVMGGPMGVCEADRYPHLKSELRLIESALKADKPVLGVCLGSQLLAAALGADVRPAGRKEIGWFPVRMHEAAEKDQLLREAPEELTPLHWHGDVFDLPKGAKLLASSELTANQAFCYGRAAYGLLFHLEMTPEMVREMVTTFADEVRDAGVDAEGIVSVARVNCDRLLLTAQEIFDRWVGLVRRPPGRA